MSYPSRDEQLRAANGPNGGWPVLFVKVKLVRPTSQAPVYMSSGAAGMDLFADFGRGEDVCTVDRLFDAGVETLVIPLGVALEIPVGWSGDLKGRSGRAARGVIDHVGTIDPDYRGELHVILHKHGWGHEVVRHGDRVAQIVFRPTGRAICEVVDELAPTARGEGGFGSTGQ